MQHPVKNDDSLSASTASPTGSEQRLSEPTAVSPLEQAIADCSSGGALVGRDDDSGVSERTIEAASDCNVDRIMTLEAAVCIAVAEGLFEGKGGLEGTIVYNNEFRRITWLIHNTVIGTNGDKGGDTIAIDAITGEVLGSYTWTATP